MSQQSDEPIFGHKQNAGTWTNSINWQERFKGSKPQKHVIMDEHFMMLSNAQPNTIEEEKVEANEYNSPYVVPPLPC